MEQLFVSVLIKLQQSHETDITDISSDLYMQRVCVWVGVPVSLEGHRAHCMPQAYPCRQQHSVYVVFWLGPSGLMHIIFLTSCQQMPP